MSSGPSRFASSTALLACSFQISPCLSVRPNCSGLSKAMFRIQIPCAPKNLANLPQLFSPRSVLTLLSHPAH
eukprot:6006605-Karenia_brevis.AAC.1